jgi:hypothetical protein
VVSCEVKNSKSIRKEEVGGIAGGISSGPLLSLEQLKRRRNDEIKMTDVEISMLLLKVFMI